jgi:hypothetical protein
MKISFTTLFLLFLIFFHPTVMIASSIPDGGPIEVNVFFDTEGIDLTHIRQEIKHVNYSRTSDAANVHLLSTLQRTGGSGRQYLFYFIGAGEFEGLNDTLYYFSSPDKTNSEIRDNYTNVIRLGLARYLAHGSQKVDVKFNGEHTVGEIENEDKWDSWVFAIRGNTNIHGEETEREFDLDFAIDAERITPEWRVEFDVDSRYDEDWYKTDGEEITATRTSRAFESLIVKSIGNHMAVGVNSGISSSTYSNIKLDFWALPAVEYNLFPYELSSRKQLRFSYRLGYNGREYLDTTIYNKINEDLFRQILSIAYKVQEKWGSAYTSISTKNYFHDFDKNSFAIYSGLYLRVWKGLSLNVSGEYSIINDRLSILKSEATVEEILTKQVQQATAYNYRLRVGLSFTFGSLYNNVVNPRLKG